MGLKPFASASVMMRARSNGRFFPGIISAAFSIHSNPVGSEIRMPTGLPSMVSARMPFAINARSIASRLLAIGVRRPFSKSRTVERETCARLARSSWLQSSHPRAARLCSGLNMTGASQDFWIRSIVFVDLMHISGYNLSQRTPLRLATNGPALPSYRRRPDALAGIGYAVVGRGSACGFRGDPLGR